jgi:hypothetical protein
LTVLYGGAFNFQWIKLIFKMTGFVFFCLHCHGGGGGGGGGGCGVDLRYLYHSVLS